MYAVVATVDITDSEAAAKTLAEQVVPMVKQAPGFVGAYFVQIDESHGTSVVVFETEEQARAGAPQIGGGLPGFTYTSVMFGEVVGRA
jgi:heme-degrading monooxygenase HmoA